MSSQHTTDLFSDGDRRRSEQGNVFPAQVVQGFIATALSHDAVADAVNDLLFEHVVKGRYHPSVISASLRPKLDEVLNVATAEDWAAVAGQLVAEARDALGAGPTRNG